MDEERDFTYDKVNFAGLPEYVDTLHSYGMHVIIILVSIEVSKRRKFSFCQVLHEGYIDFVTKNLRYYSQIANW